MSPASPSPTSPSGKPSVTQRAKNFFRKPFPHSRLKSSSKTANASTPTLVYGDTDNAARERGLCKSLPPTPKMMLKYVQIYIRECR